MEIKGISIGSIFKIFGAMSLIIGLIVGLSSGLVGVDAIKPFLKDAPFLKSVSTGINAGLIVGLVYGIVGGLVCSFLALIYNLFASIVGGIKIKVED